MKALALRLFVVIGLGILATGCGRAPGKTPAPTSKPNVIIVLVDTLRADHMGSYEYDRPTTPFLDQFATESVVFDRARSQAGCTFPSVNSLLTSRYPFDFIRQGEGQMGIPDEYPSIAEILKTRGYTTIAVSASPIVRATPSKENPNAGFDRGFDVFDEKCLWGNAKCVNKRAAKVLRNVQEPFFLYLHYMDPHGHYSPPAEYAKQFATEYEGYDFIAEGDHNPIAEMLYNDGPEIEISDRDIQHLLDLYDDEIRYFDGQFELLVDQLRDQGLFENSLIVLTSDHGEEFLEHGHVGHCRGVWDTLTRVPLMVRLPGASATGRVEEAVQLVDVVPTILNTLGADGDFPTFEGATLVPALEGGPPSRTYAFADQSRYRATDDGRWQLILDGVESTATLYDLHSDPLQQTDLFTGSHPEVDRLSAALNQWLRDTGQWVNFDQALAASKAKEEELKALGYLR